jgi:adenine phosphoribosyltransferase
MKPDLIDSIPLLDGHADVWRIFLDQSLFRRAVTELASPFLTEGITKVASVEARGFILGPAVGMQLKAGFLAIRKPGGVYPGPLIEWPTGPDWRNMSYVLRIQRHALLPSDRVLLVDDWIETGSQALAARALIEAGGATFVGTSVIIDQVPSNIRGRLGKFHALITADELGAQR